MALLLSWITPSFCGACRGFPPGAPQTLAFQTEHFQYYANEAVCDDLPDWMEEHYAAHARYLDIALPVGDRIRYFLYDQETSLREACPDQAAACTDGYDVMTHGPFDSHELVHAYSVRPRGPPAFFAEGLAEMLSGDSGLDLIVAHTADLNAQLRGTDDVNYSDAASFVRFLIDNHGVDAFMDFYEGVEEEASFNEMACASRSFLGRSLSQEVECWGRLPPQYLGDVFRHLSECARPSILDELSSGEGIEVDFSCAEVALTTGEPSEFVGKWFHLDVPYPDQLRLRLAAEGNKQAGLRGCDRFVQGDIEIPGDAESHPIELWLALGPGDYRLHVQSEVDASDATALLSGSHDLSLLAAECSQADVESLDGEMGIRLATHGIALDRELFLRFVATSDGALQVERGVSRTAGGPLTLEVCSGACDELACSGDILKWDDVEALGSQFVSLLANETYTIHLVPASQQEFLRFDLAYIVGEAW